VRHGGTFFDPENHRHAKSFAARDPKKWGKYNQFTSRGATEHLLILRNNSYTKSVAISQHQEVVTKSDVREKLTI
jgi:hypothetical protein